MNNVDLIVWGTVAGVVVVNAAVIGVLMWGRRRPGPLMNSDLEAVGADMTLPDVRLRTRRGLNALAIFILVDALFIMALSFMSFSDPTAGPQFFAAAFGTGGILALPFALAFIGMKANAWVVDGRDGVILNTTTGKRITMMYRDLEDYMMTSNSDSDGMFSTANSFNFYWHDRQTGKKQKMRLNARQFQGPFPNLAHALLTMIYQGKFKPDIADQRIPFEKRRRKAKIDAYYVLGACRMAMNDDVLAPYEALLAPEDLAQTHGTTWQPGFMDKMLDRELGI